MIDIHSHILPGVDDGAASWDDTLAMAKKARADGVRIMAATPHMMDDGPYRNRAPEVLALTDETNERLHNAGIDLHIVSGGELYLSLETSAALDRGELLTYGNQGKYALVEWATQQMLPPFVEQQLFECRLRGITPVVAHAERYRQLVDDAALATQWIEQGVLFQVNASAVTGRSGKTSRRAAWRLLNARLVHFVASDAHSVTRRPPGLQAAWEALRRKLGDEMADALCRENPRRLLAGEPAVTWKPAAASGRRGLWATLRHWV